MREWHVYFLREKHWNLSTSISCVHVDCDVSYLCACWLCCVTLACMLAVRYVDFKRFVSALRHLCACWLCWKMILCILTVWCDTCMQLDWAVPTWILANISFVLNNDFVHVDHVVWHLSACKRLVPAVWHLRAGWLCGIIWQAKRRNVWYFCWICLQICNKMASE